MSELLLRKLKFKKSTLQNFGIFLLGIFSELKGLIVALVFVGLFSVGLQLIGISMLAHLVKPDAKNTLFFYQDFISDIPTDVILLIVACCLLTSICFLFLQGMITLIIWKKYYRSSILKISQRVIEYRLHHNYDFTQYGEVASVFQSNVRLGACARLFCNFLISFLQGSFLIGSLIIINPILTLKLGTVSILPLCVTIIYFSRRSSIAARTVSSKVPAQKREIKKFTDKLFTMDKPQLLIDEARITLAQTEKRVEALTSRFLNVEIARFITGSFIVFALFAVGNYYISDKQTSVDTGGLLTYLVVGVIAGKHVANTASSISALGRFYPFIQKNSEIYRLFDIRNDPKDVSARLVGLSSVTNGGDEEEEF